MQSVNDQSVPAFQYCCNIMALSAEFRHHAIVALGELYSMLGGPSQCALSMDLYFRPRACELACAQISIRLLCGKFSGRPTTQITLSRPSILSSNACIYSISSFMAERRYSASMTLLKIPCATAVSIAVYRGGDKLHLFLCTPGGAHCILSI